MPSLMEGQKTAYQKKIQAGELVPNEPFRKRFYQLEGLFALERRTWVGSDDYSNPDVVSPVALVALRMGWFRIKKGRVSYDTTRVKRVLGIAPAAASGKKRNGVRYEGSCREFVPYGMACELARALDLDPVEAGV